METSTALSASLPAGGGQLDVRYARSIFGDVHAAAENDPSPFRRMGGETLRGVPSLPAMAESSVIPLLLLSQ